MAVSVPLANFIFEAVNFVLLVAALGWLLFRPIRRALVAEQERHQEEAARAQTELAHAEALLASNQAERDALGKRLQQEREAATKALEAELEQRRQAARAEQAQHEKSLAQHSAEMQKAQLRLLADGVGRVAALSVAGLLARFDGPSLDLALIRAAVSELQALAPPDQPATVHVARPLSPEAEALLRQALPAGFSVQERPELGAGVRVITQRGQVDGSSLAIAHQAAVQISTGLDGGTDREPEQAHG